jgi:hypothetical protein
MRYKLLTENEVDAQARRLAQMTVAEGCRVLKIPTVPVKFFRQVTEFEGNIGTFKLSGDDLFGYTNGAEIFLRHNLPDRDLITTCIHESRHCWQNKSPGWRNRGAVVRERDAQVFAAAWPRSESAIEMLGFKKLLRADG